MTAPSQLRQTHTVVVLGLSQPAFDEISAKLRAAGYEHAFMPDGEVDMSGIAVAADAADSVASGTLSSADAFKRYWDGEAAKAIGLESAESFTRRTWEASRTALGVAIPQRTEGDQA